MKNYFVYILECKTKKGDVILYTGYTSNLKARINRHIKNILAKKTTTYTGRMKFINPKPLYFEKLKTKSEALRREKEIKRMGKSYRLGLIHGMRATRRNFNTKKKL